MIVDLDYWLQLLLHIQAFLPENATSYQENAATSVEGTIIRSWLILPCLSSYFPTSPVCQASLRTAKLCCSFDFLAAMWSLNTFNKLCHLAVQIRDATDRARGLVCVIRDLIFIDQSFAKTLGPSASKTVLQCHTGSSSYSCVNILFPQIYRRKE